MLPGPVAGLRQPRYYEGSDSCAPSPRLAGLPAYLVHPSRRSASNHEGDSQVALAAMPALAMISRLRHFQCRLAITPRRIEFVILRTASSPPVAPHPASQRRSYLRLRGSGFPRSRTFTLLNKRLHGRTPERPLGAAGVLRRRPRNRSNPGAGRDSDRRACSMSDADCPASSLHARYHLEGGFSRAKSPHPCPLPAGEGEMRRRRDATAPASRGSRSHWCASAR